MLGEPPLLERGHYYYYYYYLLERGYYYYYYCDYGVVSLLFYLSVDCVLTRDVFLYFRDLSCTYSSCFPLYLS